MMSLNQIMNQLITPTHSLAGNQRNQRAPNHYFRQDFHSTNIKPELTRRFIETQQCHQANWRHPADSPAIPMRRVPSRRWEDNHYMQQISWPDSHQAQSPHFSLTSSQEFQNTQISVSDSY